MSVPSSFAYFVYFSLLIGNKTNFTSYWKHVHVWAAYFFDWKSSLALWLTGERVCMVSDVSARQHLRYATRRFLVVPRCRLSTVGPRSFSVADPSLWNSLPDSLRDPDLGRDNFRRLLKTHFYTALKQLAYYRCFMTIRSTNWLTYSVANAGVRPVSYVCETILRPRT